MKSKLYFLPALFLVLATGVLAKPPKSLLLNPPPYVENLRRPVFKIAVGYWPDLPLHWFMWPEPIPKHPGPRIGHA